MYEFKLILVISLAEETYTNCCHENFSLFFRGLTFWKVAELKTGVSSLKGLNADIAQIKESQPYAKPPVQLSHSHNSSAIFLIIPPKHLL